MGWGGNRKIQPSNFINLKNNKTKDKNTTEQKKERRGKERRGEEKYLETRTRDTTPGDKTRNNAAGTTEQRARTLTRDPIDEPTSVAPG